MRRVIAFIVLLCVAAYPAFAFRTDITGDYSCEGRNADGGVYRGVVSIVRKGDVYLVDWRIGQRDNYKGIGLLTSNVLSVSYYGGITGVVVYNRERDGTLNGRWAVLEGDGRVFTEVLTPR